jgi:protocatechuate 3,4-dioxygenase beta subunit
VPDVTTTVQGRVLDGSNGPVAGASVVVFGLITGTTDGAGFFSIQHVPSQIGSISAIARVTVNNVILEGASAATTPVDSAITNVGVIKLGQSKGSISGTITDVRNNPVANAQVTILIGAETRSTSSDANGLYAFAGFSPNSFVVSARDLLTGLRGQASGVLNANSSAVADIQLSASGTIKGTVFSTDGTTPAIGATIVLSGGATAVSDGAGQFVFDFVPLGGFVLDASDANGNRGRNTGTIRRSGVVVQSNIIFLGRGSVSGTVSDGSGNPVAGANVTLNSNSIFGGNFSTATDGNGQYSFSNVFVGSFDVTASSATLRLGGRAGDKITGDGQSVVTNVVLGPSGTVTGTIFHFDGITPVSNAQVSLTGGFTTVADGNGVYTFNFVPLGSYTISATDPGNGDQGTGSVTLGGQDEVQTVNVTLNGQGTVTATVVDATSAPVANALLTLTGQTAFGGTFSGVSQADGTFTFGAVPAGTFTVTATDSVSQAGAIATGSVAAGQSAAVTLQLQPVGSVTGIVFAADGLTPVAGISVTILGQGQISLTTTSGPDGSFTFGAVPSGTYTLQAIDGNGKIRAQASVTVATQGSTVTQNLVLSGFGTVTGTVTLNGVVSSALVTLTDATGKTSSSLTDVQGHYSVSQVAVGSFTAQAVLQNDTGNFSGFVQSQITTDGATVKADIQLVPQTRFLPATFNDVNGLPYTISQDGSLRDGLDSEFNSQFSSLPQGALRLDVIPAGGPPVSFFGGGNTASSANGGRELDIPQQNITGLTITRKIFVPRDGYFVRYIEVLQNPGSAPVNVGLRLTTGMRNVTRFGGSGIVSIPPTLVATSSGDNILDVSPPNPDRWVILDDDKDIDPFVDASENLPPLSHIFDGPGGTVQATSAQFTQDASNHQGILTEEFDNINVPAGGQVALLHFLSIETTRNSSLASALRLAQLPPEALAGIDPNDLASIQNFVPPANGVSALGPLEPLFGEVTGKVLAGDGTFGVANAQVSFQSNDPLFARTHTVTADSSGVYLLVAQFNDLGSSLAVPAAAFTVQATDVGSGQQSGVIVGNFASGSTVAQQDIAFSASAVLRGTVRKASGEAASSGTVQIIGTVSIGTPNPKASGIVFGGTLVTVQIASDGTYAVLALPPGNYSLIATVPDSQGGPANAGTATVTIVQGQDAVGDITLKPTGSVTGTIFSVSNVPVPNLAVQLHTDLGDYHTGTDNSGNFDFVEVLPGEAHLEAFDSTNNSGAGATVTVVAGQNVNQNLSLSQGTGAVTGSVVDQSGRPVPGAQVTLTAGDQPITLTSAFTTDGMFTFTPEGILPGTFHLSLAPTVVTFKVTTDANGTYFVTGVPVGPLHIDVISADGRSRGQADDFLDLPGTTKTLKGVLLFSQGS